MVAQSSHGVARHDARRTLLRVFVDILCRRVSASGRLGFVSDIDDTIQHGERSGLDHAFHRQSSTIDTSLFVFSAGAIIGGWHNAVLYAPNLRGGKSEFVGVLPVGKSVPLLISKREFGQSAPLKLFAVNLAVGC